MNKTITPTQKITNDHGEPHTYVFEEDAINAINAALLINRPLLISFVGWIRNAIQHLCVNKQGFVGWRCAYPTYQSTDLIHHQGSNE